MRYGWWNTTKDIKPTLSLSTNKKYPSLPEQVYHYNTSDVTTTNLFKSSESTPSLQTIQSNNLSLQHAHPSQKNNHKILFFS